MASYGLYLVLATLTVLSPGPGVVLTISNALRHGWSGSLPGIVGIASGAFIVAGICASSLGLILAASATAFTVLKYIGALYLLYLGIKMWRTQRFIPELKATSPRPWRRFIEALSIQLLNPKAGFFFLAVFPQFIKPAGDYCSQFFLLVSSYSLLVVVVHSGYALVAQAARGWLSTNKGARIVGKLSGITFLGFGVLMASASK
ncbi:LysE family translocator [Pseudomonas fluorescens]|uniref:LysE family translocator n=1 Tax=Pseudomonas fluorescens TaxID=294 RepID=A0A944DSR1_PSEFL|nr:LysE family translocator [Pseudomonas fluorescens]MBT2294794.1 LysE family translocator [Pseudomonas fluorescens]MBT2308514.1 LysE family translocator [Pseudomonas fluorescens]MBT2311584.1 LysE family translocator [Pseudomonas fluorescens]MBT2319751.1 LysE family translocator [Pseudomonas fluorescens]MBT2331535.1 LysE family translocator [Pseudomonas fluorescens]